MQISEKGLRFIASLEGLSLKAYKDSAGVPTIGHGTIKYPNGDIVKMGDTCTVEQADNWLRFEAVEKCAYLDRELQRFGVTVNQNQFDAMGSFIYNLGEGVLSIDRSFGIAVRTGERGKICSAMMLYCKYTKLGIKFTSKGLLDRRSKEVDLFLS